MLDVISSELVAPRDALWNSVKNDLMSRYGEGVFISWFSKIKIVSSNQYSVTLGVPTNFMKDWIKANYLDVMTHLFAHYDNSLKNVEIVTIAENENSNNAKIACVTEIASEDTDTGFISGSSLDNRFTFDNFVVGPPNELAYAAAKAVAESKGAIPESNPLFLYGGVGLGKTHLMHAIALSIKQENPERKVIYMSAEKFMYQFVSALRSKDVMSFKERFRSVDVLMIDDIQFICGKDSTQEEFFHTFNALIDNNRQMVISCDRSPSNLDNIEDRIKSRLGWGLVADVHSTTYELRLGILYSKLEQLKTTIPQNVIEFLASKITSNVRELEGALNKVIAHATLIGREVTIANTKETLRDLLRSNERIITIEDIQKKVAERYNIKVSDMSSSRRYRNVARPRQIAMYLSKNLTPRSLADIGKKFGNKDHTTVMHAIKRIETLTQSDVEFREEIDLLIRILQN